MASSVKEFFETIKVEHTIFALPFAYMTLFLVEGGWPGPATFAWITLAMVTARTFGMAANRLIDAEIDIRNPRTAGRAIPARRLSKGKTILYMVVFLALFLVAVYRLAPVCRRLWPVVICAMVIYPYAKRFTSLAHLFLGAVYLMIPTAIWMAVTNELAPVAIILGAGAGLWVAGFDIIYACQDIDSDRKEGLHSIPADLGVPAGLWISRIFHFGFVVLLGWAGVEFGVGKLYYVGLGLTAVLLIYEHRLVTPNDLSRVNAAFFTVNGLMSIALFVLVAMDTVI